MLLKRRTGTLGQAVGDTILCGVAGQPAAEVLLQSLEAHEQVQLARWTRRQLKGSGPWEVPEDGVAGGGVRFTV